MLRSSLPRVKPGPTQWPTPEVNKSGRGAGGGVRGLAKKAVQRDCYVRTSEALTLRDIKPDRYFSTLLKGDVGTRHINTSMRHFIVARSRRSGESSVAAHTSKGPIRTDKWLFFVGLAGCMKPTVSQFSHAPPVWWFTKPNSWIILHLNQKYMISVSDATSSPCTFKACVPSQSFMSWSTRASAVWPTYSNCPDTHFWKQKCL